MKIRVRGDGRVELDWDPPAGPYILLTETQWDAFRREIRKWLS